MLRRFCASHMGKRIDEPKRTDQERALAPSETVNPLLRRIAGNKRSFSEFALNSSHRTDDAGIIICKEPTAGDEQQTGVERLAAVVLDEGLPVGVIPVLADVLVNVFPQPLPALDGILPASGFRELDRAVDGVPGREL